METATATTTGSIPTTKSGLPLYEVRTNKNGVAFKIANFNNPDVCPQEGIVEYEAIKKKDFERLRDGTFSCPLVKDKQSDIYYGIFAGFADNGDPKWQRFQLGMLNIYDRSISTEAKKACILSKSAIVEGSPNALWRLTMFRMVDKELAATQKIKRIKDGQRAITIAQGLYGEDLYNYARNLGLGIDNMSVSMIEAEVLTRAQDSPVEFLAIHDNPNLEVITIFNRALDTRVVENDITTGYKFQGYIIGHNFDLAIDFLLKNKDILTTIDVRSKEKVDQTRKIMSKSEATPSKTEDQLKIEELQKQLSDLKEATKNKNAEGMRETMTEEEKVLAALKEKGAFYKLKGLHNYSTKPESMAKLKARIEECEAKETA